MLRIGADASDHSEDAIGSATPGRDSLFTAAHDDLALLSVLIAERTYTQKKYSGAWSRIASRSNPKHPPESEGSALSFSESGQPSAAAYRTCNHLLPISTAMFRHLP